MTRTEFINSITTWQELLIFCDDVNCGVCEDIISYDELGIFIADDFRRYSHEYDWQDIRDWLENISTDAYYYYRSGSFFYEDIDNKFEEYKAQVLLWCDETTGIFDEDDTPNEDRNFGANSEDESQEEIEISDNDYSIEELIGLCS